MSLTVQNIKNVYAAQNGYTINLVCMDKEIYTQKLVNRFLCIGQELPKDPHSKYLVNGIFEHNEKGYCMKVANWETLPPQQAAVPMLEVLIEETMVQNEANGNTYFSTLALIETVKSSLKLSYRYADEKDINRALLRLMTSKVLRLDRDMIYRSDTLEAEKNLAFNVARVSNHRTDILEKKIIEHDIREQEKRMGLLLAREQKNAVIRTLNSQFSIINGGPGTGKTEIVSMITNIYLDHFPDRKIFLLSPTGKAAIALNRGLQEHIDVGSQDEAKTIHSQLGLIPDGSGGYEAKEFKPIDADFLFVDEASMVDLSLADYLFQAIQDGTRLVIIGDPDQLESIGLGKVLFDMIHSHVIPVTTLNKTFRQKDNSRIAINKERIKRGNDDLEYGDDFRHIESTNFKASSDLIVGEYMRLVKTFGIQNVMILTPYRVATESGVNALNPRIRNLINPQDGSKKYFWHQGKKFYENDRIVFINNTNCVKNGETGTIVSINKNMVSFQIDKSTQLIQFSESDETMQIDWAYALTVYKSQGSECAHCIITIQKEHFNIKRNLLFTGITRAKKSVVIIGEIAAVKTAILNAGGLGETRLKERLIEEKGKIKNETSK